MKFKRLAVTDVVEIELTPHRDSRGFFSRLYCPEEFAKAGIRFDSTQINLSRNSASYTLRGLHWQEPPASEAKIVRVTSGAAYDVIVDLRRESVSFKCWVAVTLDAERANAVFVPAGCAHGFLTLEPNTDVLYQMSQPFVEGYARGLRWDDPALQISWPKPPSVVSDADLSWPGFSTIAI